MNAEQLEVPESILRMTMLIVYLKKKNRVWNHKSSIYITSGDHVCLVGNHQYTACKWF